MENQLLLIIVLSQAEEVFPSHVQAYKGHSLGNQALNSVIRNTITVVTYRKLKITSTIVATLVQLRHLLSCWFWWVAAAWNSTRICFRTSRAYKSMSVSESGGLLVSSAASVRRIRFNLRPIFLFKDSQRS